MGFRDYDPGLNRFLTRDMYNGALEDMQLTLDPWNMNWYVFAGGNPISFIELDGHIPVLRENSNNLVGDYIAATGHYYTPSGSGRKADDETIRRERERIAAEDKAASISKGIAIYDVNIEVDHLKLIEQTLDALTLRRGFVQAKKFKWSFDDDDCPDYHRSHSGVVIYGCTDLSKAAIDFRKRYDLRDVPPNVAVAEFLLDNGEFKLVIARSSGEKGHAEQRINNFLNITE